MAKRAAKRHPARGRRHSQSQAALPGVRFRNAAGYTVIEGLAINEPWEQRRDRFSAVRAELPDRIRAGADEIEAFIAEFDALDLLARFAMRNLVIDPESYKEYSHTGRQAFVEYLSLLILKRPHERDKSRVVTEDTLAELQHKIRKVYTDATWFYALAGIEDSAAEGPQTQTELAFRSVLSELYVRNHEYRHVLEQSLIELFEPLDDLVRSECGFTIRDAVSLARAIPALMGARLAVGLQFVRVESDNLRKAVNAKLRGHQLDERADAYPTEVIEGLVAMKPRRMRAAIDAYAHELGLFGLSGALSISADELASEARVGSDAATAFLQLLSLEFGAVDDDFFAPHTESLLTETPIIRVEGKYFVPVPEMPSYQLRHAMEQKFKQSNSAWRRYQERRSAFVETQSVRVIADALHTTESWVNLRYPRHDSDGWNELDGLILFDTVLILIECKAGKFGPAARRGAPRSMVSGLKDLVGDAHAQAIRAMKYISDTNEPEFTTQDGQLVRLDKSRFTRTIPITVTLEPLDAFLPVLARTSELGVFGEGDLPWAVYLFDLKVVTDLIEFPAQLIHYLQRRLALNEAGTRLHVHDELDWFGLYLKRNLYFEHLKGTEFARMGFLTHTTDFDEYFMHQTGARMTPSLKPRQDMPELYRRLISDLQALPGQGHVEVVCWLLDLGTDGRTEFVKGLETARRRAELDGKDHSFSMLVEDNRGMAIVAGRDSTPDDFRAHLESFCFFKKYQTKREEWLGIGSHVSGRGLVTGFVIAKSPWAGDPELDELVKEYFPTIAHG